MPFYRGDGGNATSSAEGTFYSSEAQRFAQEANTSAVNAKTSETNASTSANTSSTKATEASTSATNAKTSETNAATSATNSANSATNSANSATLAQQWATKTDAEVAVGQGFGAKKYADDAAASAASIVKTDYIAQKGGLVGAAMISAGTQLERPAMAVGEYGFRFNKDTVSFEGWNGSVWDSVGGGARGGVGNPVFYENDKTVTTSYTLTSGKNAMSAGPITIADGAVVTIPDGSVWTVV